MSDKLHRVVVIGGGFGGLAVAQGLSRAPVHVTLLDRRNFHLFQPMLYQVATGTLSAGNIAASLRSTLRHQKNAHVLLGEMTGLDAAGKRVILADGEIPYDSLVIATGSVPYYIRHDEWREHAPGLKTVEDAIAMRSRILRAFESAERETDPKRIQEWLTFVIVGAGPTGVELAGALAEVAYKTLRNDYRQIDPRSARVLLINGDDRVLREYAPDLSAKAERSLERLGVTVRNNRFVTDIQADSVTFGKGPDAERVLTRTVLWAAGVRASPIGEIIKEATHAELDREGRVRVGSDLRVPGQADFFVIGDLACVEEKPGVLLPGVAPVAIQEGRYVAKAIAHRLRSETPEPFKYHSHGSLATIGRHRAIADLGWIKFDGILAWFAWAVVHLVNIVEFEDRLLVMMQWLWNYLTWSRSDMLITYTTPPAEPTEKK